MGSRIAQVRVNDHDGDNVTVEVQPSSWGLHGPAAFGGNFKDGAEYFDVRQSPNAARRNEWVVVLKKSLIGSFKENDQLTLSMIAHDGSITTRNELFAIVQGHFHGDAPPGKSLFRNKQKLNVNTL